jgi:hypothetical protein
VRCEGVLAILKCNEVRPAHPCSRSTQHAPLSLAMLRVVCAHALCRQTTGLYDHFHRLLADRVVILRRTGLFAHVEPEAMMKLGVLARPVKYNRGDVILRQGAPADCFYVLCRGVCKVGVDGSGCGCGWCGVVFVGGVV